jgi:hypothetical protein
MAEVNYFKADLHELEFELFEHFRMGGLLEHKPYDHITVDDVRMILKEAHTFATEVIGPTMRVTDQQGCELTPEGVKVPQELHTVYKQYYENAWNSLTVREEDGGQGAPRLLGVAVTEMMSGANTAFNMYPGLTSGAAELIRSFGSPAQKERFLGQMESGQWSGTMVLTEPQAGSDVGLSTTKAEPMGNGAYKITGNKIFISGGDHDMAENIIHMALARIEGAPKGTRGLSLFIIPKYRVNEDGSLGESNNVTCTNIEHKMGINASATAALAFGEAGDCVGFLLGGEKEDGGEPGGGIARMFQMMNGARIGVGVQSLAVASTAYLNALDYARTRLQGAHITKGRPEQGAVAIIQHADVRRMLLEMKATVEGCRALIYHAVRLTDEAEVLRAKGDEGYQDAQDYLGLYIPLVKAHVSDSAVAVSNMALQVYGGAGYTADFPAEQYVRDSRIFPIYEGTNGIQALDLVGRKLTQNGGALIGRFSKEMGEFSAALSARDSYAAEGEVFGRALEGFNKCLGKYMEFFSQGKMELVPLTATRFLDAMSKLVIARLLLEGGFLAQDKRAGLADDASDVPFYEGKVATARYYARNILPSAITAAEVIVAGDSTALDIEDRAFSLTY